MASIKDVFVIMTIAVCAIGIIVLFVQSQANDVGGTVDSRINNTVNNLNGYNSEFNNVRQQFENLSDAAREADVGDFAYFGIRGMVAIMKTPFLLIGTVKSAIEAVGSVFDFVPVQIINAIAVLGVIVLLFAAIRFLTSRGNEP